VSNYDAFAAIYDQWSAHMTEDVPYYVELARETAGPLVELAVGSGRVAVPVARETGRSVLGIDSSPAMLAQARERADAAGVQLRLREADMREFEVDEPAGLVYCPFRALLHLPSWHDKRRAFECVAAALRPGGRFAWNAFCFSYRVAVENEGHNDDPVPHTVTHSPAESRIDIALESGGETSIWWATKAEWEGLLDVAGLETEALYGWFDRRPFDDESEEFVWIARKPS
jgi:ubiquinone/menaquinone biosynthesis C-methylase UbiE